MDHIGQWHVHSMHRQGVVIPLYASTQVGQFSRLGAPHFGVIYKEQLLVAVVESVKVSILWSFRGMAKVILKGKVSLPQTTVVRNVLTQSAPSIDLCNAIIRLIILTLTRLPNAYLVSSPGLHQLAILLLEATSHLTEGIAGLVTTPVDHLLVAVHVILAALSVEAVSHLVAHKEAGHRKVDYRRVVWVKQWWLQHRHWNH